MKFGLKVLERFFIQGLTLIGLMGVNVIVARSLGPDGKGALSLAMLVPTLIYVFGNFGLFLSNNYFLGRLKESVHKLVTNSVIFSVVSSLFFSLVFIAFFPLLRDRFFHGVSSHIIFSSLVALPFLQLIAMLNGFLLLKARDRFYNLMSFLKTVLHLSLTVILLLIFHYGLYAALFAWIVAQALVGLLSLYDVIKIYNIHFDFDFPLLVRAFKHGLKGYFGNFINFLNKRVDTIMISIFLTLGDVGVYSITLAMSEAMLQLPISVTTLLFPRVSNATDEQSNDFTPRIFRNMIVILIALALFSALISKPFVSLFFGPEFLGSIMPFYLTLPGTVFIGLTAILSNDLAGRGFLSSQSLIAFVGYLSNIIFNFLLIPPLGIRGAGLSSSCAFFIMMVMAVIIFRKKTKTPLSELFILRKSDMQYYLNMLARFHLAPARFRTHESK